MIEKKYEHDLNKLVTKGQILLNESLAQYTTIKIGGPAKFFIRTKELKEITEVWQYCQKNSLRIFLLGGGSNLVFTDKGFPGVVLKLLPNQEKYQKQKDTVQVTFPGGFNTHLASMNMMEKSLSGFEYLYGLPGTIGGAVYMNAKWPKANYQTSDNLVEVSYLSKKGRIEHKPNQLTDNGFGESPYQKSEGIILSATFQFSEQSSTNIKKTCLEVYSHRKATQPYGVFTAGCVFKNITQAEQKKQALPSCSTGYYIERCGLKGKRFGNLQISTQHANFFINYGQAKAEEYEELVLLVKTKVKQKFNLDLQEEVILVK